MVLTLSSLKLLHCLLLKLSPNETPQQSKFGDEISLSVSNNWFITKVKCTDIIGLANLLYEDLLEQFGHILNGTSNLPFILVSDNNGHIISDIKLSAEKFVLLLRCSLIILQFLEFDLTIMLERCQILVGVLRVLCPLSPPQDERSLIPTNSPPNSPQCLLDPDAMMPSITGASSDIFSSVLEVFIDELLVHPEMRKHFTMADCVSSSNEKLFVSHSYGDDGYTILELISHHFLLSVHDDLSFKRFIYSLSWSSEVGGELYELRLDSALTIIGQRIMFSAPQLLQTHLILLASKCIGSHMSVNDRRSDVVKMNRYILAFELSFNLYIRYLPAINFADNIFGGNCEGSTYNEGISFDSYVCTVTYNRLNLRFEKLIDFHHMHANDFFSGTTDDTIRDSIAYIKGNQHFIDETCREKTCSILEYIITVVLLWEKEMSHEDVEHIQQEIFCVAAVLKLMGSSLLHIMWLLRQDETLGGRNAKHSVICKEYDFILGIASRFENYGGNRSLEKLIFEVMGSKNGRHKEIILMLSHFASLLLYSHRKRIDFLWKGCIFMLMSLLNLFIFKDGNMDAFGQLLCNLEKASLLRSSQAKSLKDRLYRQSSVRIASNIKKARDEIKNQKYLDHSTGNGQMADMEPQDAVRNFSNILPTKDKKTQHAYPIEAITRKMKNFLECSPGYNDNNHLELDDLEDFIDSSPRKDYSSWLKKRERYRNWKHKKTACPKRTEETKSILSKKQNLKRKRCLLPH